MKIYLIRQIIEKVEGYELQNVKTNLYGAYRNKEDAIRKARKIVAKLIEREKVIILDDEVSSKTDIPFKRSDAVVLYKGNDYSWWRRHFIEIVTMELK